MPGRPVGRRGRRRGWRRGRRGSSPSRLVRMLAPMPAGHREGRRAAAGGDPDLRLALHRRREHRHLDRPTVAAARPAPPRRATAPARSRCPRPSARGDRSKFSGASAKSLACQPEANDSPTRPLDRLSTTDQSSAHADRVVQRQHHAAGADLDALGDDGDRGAGQRPGSGTGRRTRGSGARASTPRRSRACRRTWRPRAAGGSGRRLRPPASAAK